MSDEVILKRVEIKGDRDTVSFLWKYVEQKRMGIFEKALERASLNPDDPQVTCAIVQHQTKAGYMGAARDGEEWPMKELSRQLITLNELQGMFER